MEEFVKEMGFDGELEFYRLVSSVDITNANKLAIFTEWKENDGTKAGLLKVIELCNHQ